MTTLIAFILLASNSHAEPSCFNQAEALRVTQRAERDEFEKKVAPTLSFDEARKQRRALSDAQLAKNKAEFDQCMEQRRVKRETQGVELDPCLKEIEQKMKANSSRIDVLRATRPKLPSHEEGKAAFDAYLVAKKEFNKKIDELEAEVKAENKALSESMRNCRSE
jgi:hypothetical protein